VWGTTSGVVQDSLFLGRDRVGSFAVSSDGKRLAYSTPDPSGRVVLHVASLDRRVVDEVNSNAPLQPIDWIEGDRRLIVELSRSDGTIREAVVSWSQGVASVDTTEAPFESESADGTLRCMATSSVELWRRAAPATRIRLQDGNSDGCRISPDGRRAVWWSRGSIYVAPTDSSGARSRVQVASGGPGELAWNRDGTKIYYRNADQWYAITPGTGGMEAKQQLLFRGHFLQARISWGLGPDGRLLLLAGPNPPPANRLNVLTNFPAYVKQRLRAAP
jgi:dipeptidyl aminopeptidase/acylaminoacyl peptidase